MMQQAPQSGGGMLSGLGSTIAQGFAFGTGSAVAHRAVGAVADSFSGSKVRIAGHALTFSPAGIEIQL
jgi:type IV secretory pathway TrbL component